MVEVVAAVVVPLLVALITALVTLRRSRDDTVVQVLMQLLEDRRKESDYMRQEIDRLRGEIDRLERKLYGWNGGSSEKDA